MDLQFIALRLTRHNDRQSILTAYSRERGRVSLAVPATAGPAARRVRALVMPMSVAACVADFRPGREVSPASQVRQAVALPSLHAHPGKQMTALFLAEVLNVVLADGAPDPALFDFIVSALRVLDGAEGMAAANFHICFLAQLTRPLGIAPDMASYGPGRVLDLRGGAWRQAPPIGHDDFVAGAEAQGTRRLAQMTFANMGRYKYTRPQRARVLNGILGYYSLHYVSLASLRSLEVLRSLTADV